MCLKIVINSLVFVLLDKEDGILQNKSEKITKVTRFLS